MGLLVRIVCICKAQTFRGPFLWQNVLPQTPFVRNTQYIGNQHKLLWLLVCSRVVRPYVGAHLARNASSDLSLIARWTTPQNMHRAEGYDKIPRSNEDSPDLTAIGGLLNAVTPTDFSVLFRTPDAVQVLNLWIWRDCTANTKRTWESKNTGKN